MADSNCICSSPRSLPAEVPLSRNYNVQFTATGQWFHIDRTEDANGLVLLAIKAYARFEQIPFIEASR